MTIEDHKQLAYNIGTKAKQKHLQRVSPFYEIDITIDGVTVDITAELDKAFYDGYDGNPFSQEEPKNVPV